MRVQERENFHLIDKDYEVWGLEVEEIILSMIAALLLTLPLVFIHIVLMSSFSGIWLFFLLKLKNYKSHEKVRGRIVRKLYSLWEDKVLKRRICYV